jgi:hypothetical protein
MGKMKHEARESLLRRVQQLDALADSQGLDEEGGHSGTIWKTRLSTWMVWKRSIGGRGVGCDGLCRDTLVWPSSKTREGSDRGTHYRRYFSTFSLTPWRLSLC